MISVCIATYNGQEYIKDQIDSIICQLSENDEIIITDDNSKDDTLAILKSYNDKRIKIYEGAHKGSPIWNFEKALTLAKGDYIFLADQDDKWLENKIEVSMSYLRKYDCIVSDNVTIDSNQNVIADSFYKLNGTKPGKYYNLLGKNGYLGCCMAFNRKVLERSLPFPANTPMHDIWIGNVAAFYYKIKFIPEKLILFCRHGDNASSTASKSKYGILARIKFRTDIIKDLISVK